MNRPAALSIMLILMLPAMRAAADDLSADLPPAQELVEQAEQACLRSIEEDGDPPIAPLHDVSTAWARLGEYDRARKAAGLLTGIHRGLALKACWKIRFDQTGTIGEPLAGVPNQSALERSFHQTLSQMTAITLGRAGRLPEAERFLPEEDGSTQAAYVRVGYHLPLARHHAELGQTEKALAHLEQAWALRERFKPHWTTTGEWLEEIVRLRKLLGQSERAKEAAVQAHRMVKTLAETSEPHILTVRRWAQVGHLHALCGQVDQSREAFGHALKMISQLEAADPDREGSTARLTARDAAESLGKVAARQYQAEQHSDSQQTLTQALARARSIDLPTRDYVLLEILEDLCEAGNVDGGRQIVEVMETPFYKASGYCLCINAMRKDEPADSGTELLRKAEAHAAVAESPSDRLSAWIRIAEAHAARGDDEAARRCLKKADEAAAAGKSDDPLAFTDGILQPIARARIRLGYLDDAWQTIRQIPDEFWRLQPLAELADEVARRDAAKRNARANLPD